MLREKDSRPLFCVHHRQGTSLSQLPDGRANASPCRERTCYIGNQRNLLSAIRCSTGFPHPTRKDIRSFSILSKLPMGETYPVFPRIGHPENRLEKFIDFRGPNGLTAMLA